jgi:hypothetical protein
MRGPACEAALRVLDSCWEPGALTEREREVLKHFDECAACSREREARVRVTVRWKQAVQGQPVDPYLEARIRRRLRETGSGAGPTWGWGRRLLPVAAVLLMCLGGWIAYQLGHLRLTTASQEAYIRAISASVSGILRVGLGDHVHCTVFRKLPKAPPSAPEMVRELGPEYGGLLAVVKARVPSHFRVVMAHRCSYHGRKFVHLALKGDSSLMSLVITRRDGEESFAADGLHPVLAQTGVSIYQDGVQRFAVAGFEAGEHLAYLVSDLGERQNLSIAAALSHDVSDFLSKLEG